jgi:putative ABC transport system ATP-binding protein
MLTLLENVMLPMDFAEMYAFEERPARALDLLELVGLEEFKDTLPAFVSNGQQQLAAIARALACDPPLLVADEPTGNLDHKSSMIIVDLFEQLSRQGKTILMVTHDSDMSSRTTRSIIISDGELVDEQVAGALSWLPDGELLRLSKIAERVMLPLGEVLVRQKESFENLYLVSRGRVELTKSGFGRRRTVVGALGPGAALGEVEILRRKRAQFSAAAAGDQPVELLAIPADSFRLEVHSAAIPSTELDRILDQKQALDKAS